MTTGNLQKVVDELQPPTNLEEYSLRLNKFLESLNASAYVNVVHLFFLCAHQLHADEKTLRIYAVYLDALVHAGKREIKEHRPYADISFQVVVKSFIDPRFYSGATEMNRQQPNIVRVVSFLEALMAHVNDTTAKEHWHIHEQFFQGNHQPLVDMYENINKHAEPLATKLKDFRITSYEPFPHVSEIDPELLDMFNMMDQMLD